VPRVEADEGCGEGFDDHPVTVAADPARPSIRETR
jgi:hypothetical protein